MIFPGLVFKGVIALSNELPYSCCPIYDYFKTICIFAHAFEN